MTSPADHDDLQELHRTRTDRAGHQGAARNEGVSGSNSLDGFPESPARGGRAARPALVHHTRRGRVRAGARRARAPVVGPLWSPRGQQSRREYRSPSPTGSRVLFWESYLADARSRLARLTVERYEGDYRRRLKTRFGGGSRRTRSVRSGAALDSGYEVYCLADRDFYDPPVLVALTISSSPLRVCRSPSAGRPTTGRCTRPGDGASRARLEDPRVGLPRQRSIRAGQRRGDVSSAVDPADLTASSRRFAPNTPARARDGVTCEQLLATWPPGGRQSGRWVPDDRQLRLTTPAHPPPGRRRWPERPR